MDSLGINGTLPSDLFSIVLSYLLDFYYSTNSRKNYISKRSQLACLEWGPFGIQFENYKLRRKKNQMYLLLLRHNAYLNLQYMKKRGVERNKMMKEFCERNMTTKYKDITESWPIGEFGICKKNFCLKESSSEEFANYLEEEGICLEDSYWENNEMVVIWKEEWLRLLRLVYKTMICCIKNKYSHFNW
jgi:hypothetical protein